MKTPHVLAAKSRLPGLHADYNGFLLRSDADAYADRVAHANPNGNSSIGNPNGNGNSSIANPDGNCYGDANVDGQTHAHAAY